MPSYSFEVVNPETGEVVAHFDVPLPVAQRDSLTLRREQVPKRVGFANGIENPENNANLRCLRRFEQRVGTTSEFHRRIGFSPETYKNAWANHKVTDD